ncbi:MAG: translation initiation factor 2 [Lachnospiraceae bacterium]|nr:translation initiation factor 2 [Lachnospiraceae bacterium]
MLGAHKVIVSNKYLKYEFVIKRNITVIKGNSATGKTTLIEMIREYNEEEDSGVSVQCDKKCVAVYGKDWEKRIQDISNAIVFIDEAGRFTKSTDFAKVIQNTNNYYVIVSREKLGNLPFSIDEIYGIRERGKYPGIKSEYTLNEFYHIYGQQPQNLFEPEVIVTEDSNSGYEFFSKVCEEKLECLSAKGKSNVLSILKKDEYKSKRRLAIVDGAAFGSEIEIIMIYIINVDNDIKIYAPESFEYLLLLSEIFDSKKLQHKLTESYDFIDSEKYFSWEQYYTALIMEETRGTEKQYSKSNLNPYYLSERNIKYVLEKIPDNIIFDKERSHHVPHTFP